MRSIRMAEGFDLTRAGAAARVQALRRSRLRIGETRVFQVEAELAEVAAHGGENLSGVGAELAFAGIGAKEGVFEVKLQRAVERRLREQPKEGWKAHHALAERHPAGLIIRCGFLPKKIFDSDPANVGLGHPKAIHPTA